MIRLVAMMNTSTPDAVVDRLNEAGFKTTRSHPTGPPIVRREVDGWDAADAVRHFAGQLDVVLVAHEFLPQSLQISAAVIA